MKSKIIIYENQLIIASNEASIKAGEISIREFVKTNGVIKKNSFAGQEITASS